MGRQSSKRSIETLLLLKAIRMRHKCEALWHYCNSPLEVHSLRTSRTVRAASALDQREDRTCWIDGNVSTPFRSSGPSNTISASLTLGTPSDGIKPQSMGSLTRETARSRIGRAAGIGGHADSPGYRGTSGRSRVREGNRRDGSSGSFEQKRFGIL